MLYMYRQFNLLFFDVSSVASVSAWRLEEGGEGFVPIVGLTFKRRKSNCGSPLNLEKWGIQNRLNNASNGNRWRCNWDTQSEECSKKAGALFRSLYVIPNVIHQLCMTVHEVEAYFIFRFFFVAKWECGVVYQNERVVMAKENIGFDDQAKPKILKKR